MSTHVGTRTKEECQKHYEEVFLGVKENEEEVEEDDSMEVDGVIRKRKRAFMPVSFLHLEKVASSRIAHGHGFQG